MQTGLKAGSAAIGLLLMASAMPAGAGDVDLHWFWHQRCFECHGAADTFARGVLKVENGTLVGRHHRQDLLRFMGQHENGGTHARGLYDMLLGQVTATPTFEQKCAGCHQSPAEFARASLATADGVLIGKTNRRPVAEYLKTHGALAPEEIQSVVVTLARALLETGKATGQ